MMTPVDRPSTAAGEGETTVASKTRCTVGITSDSRHSWDIEFALGIARAYQEFGIPSHRLETTLAMLNERLGLDGQFYSTPNAVFVSFGKGANQRTFFLRSHSGEVNLEKVDDLLALATRVATGRLSTREAMTDLEAIVNGPERYPRWIQIISFSLASGGASILFGGGWRELAAASLAGLCVGWLAVSAASIPRLARLVPPLAAVFAVVIAKTAALVLGPYSIYIAVVTGLIVLVPGLTLTSAMAELATGHPVSGTARLANACVVFLMMGFGVALGSQVERCFIEPVASVAPLAPSAWTYLLALLITPLAFVVLFRARPQDYPLILVTGWIGFFSARIIGHWLDPQLAGFVGALALGLVSNGFAKITDRPASILLVPGIMLLVPGSMGFKSVSALLEGDTLSGVSTAFSVGLVAASLVAGLILANGVISPKRAI